MLRAQRASHLRFSPPAVPHGLREIEAPEHDRRREKFDRAVAAEAEKRRAAGYPSRAQRHRRLYSHPDECKNLNPNCATFSL